ncbi:MAG: glycosyltransferase family 39 protein [Planctomycetaceae bacterium]
MSTTTAEIVRSAETAFPADRRVGGHPGAEGLLSDDAQRQLIGWFLALGVLARCVRYFLHFPLWEDECFLCINLIDRGYLGLLEPLQYHQVAPPLFLWVELTVVKLLGFNEWALRLFPFLCGLASLFLFRHVAGRLIRGPALVFAVATFAVAYSGIRYSAEAKQYGADLFVSLTMIAFVVEWWRDGRARWLWMLAGFVPIAVGSSYPATFVGGGLSLFVAAVLVRDRARLIDWRPWLAFNVALLAGFAAVFLVAARGQSQAELEFMADFWNDAFPPWRTPLRLPLWLLDVHASDLLSYPIGGSNGASTLTFLAVAAAIVLLARRREFFWLLLALAPFAVHFAAAVVERYPYGSHVKFSQHLAPFICLLTGLGGTVWIGLLRRKATIDEFAEVTSDELRVTRNEATRHSSLSSSNFAGTASMSQRPYAEGVERQSPGSLAQRAHPGLASYSRLDPVRVGQAPASDDSKASRLVEPFQGSGARHSDTQGGAAAPLTLGFVVQPLRGMWIASTRFEWENLKLLTLVPRHSLAHALLIGTLLFPALAGAGSIIRDIWYPYKNESDMRARAFAQWFWANAQSEGEVVCLTTDLDRTFSPDAYRQLSWTAMYLCNQRIYSPRHQAGDPPRLDDVSASRPLRCLLYRDPRWEFDDDAFATWLAAQRSRYRIVGRETYPFPRYDKRKRHILTTDYIEEFKFVPRDAPPARFAELELDGARS